MNKLNLLILTVLPFSFLCCIGVGNLGRTVSGNGNVVKETRSIGPFKEIKASAGVNVFLFQGNEEKVVVEADENIQNCIITEVNGSTLSCYIDCNIRHSKKMNVYVNYKSLNSITASSGSDISGETIIKADNLDINVSSGAEIKVEVDAERVNCNTSSGSDAVIEGKTNYFEGDASSGSEIKALGLTSKSCNVRSSSAGEIDITVTEKIDANASSGGEIDYAGNPEIVDINESSGGDVSRH